MRIFFLASVCTLAVGCGELEYSHPQEVHNLTNQTVEVRYRASGGGLCMGDSETVTEKIRPGTRKQLDVTFRNDIGGCGELLEEVSYRVPPERRYTTLEANGSGYVSCQESGKTVDCRWLQKTMTSVAANAAQ